MKPFVKSGLVITAGVSCVLAVCVSTASAQQKHAILGATQAPKASDTVFAEPEDNWQSVYKFINSATKTLDMTMYELADTTAQQDLAADAKKGVKVRVILDQNREQSNNQAAYDYLKSNGVDVVWAPSGFAATHQKTITVDGTTSLILTGNLTSRYYSTTRDFGVIDPDATDVQAIEDVFNADFASKSITPNDGDDLVWSPTDSQSQLEKLIDSAQSSLSIENEEMGDSTIVNDLVNAAKRGVDVKVTMTNTGNNYASEFNTLTSAGVHVSTYSSSASLYIHAKVIIADYGKTGAKVFLGSENFSDYSLNKNRELGLITTDSGILDSVNSTLSSDYSGATPWNG
ncbi:MAG: hypothetical protein J2O49_02880 [Sciscionella sp.]|nr:hypothetical protein [Sciscionella sp.]